MMAALGNERGGEMAAVIAATFACGPDLARTLSAAAQPCAFAARTTILDYEVERGDVHLVVDGHARLTVNSIDGRMVVVEDYTVGDLFGEAGLFVERAEAGGQICAVSATSTGAFAMHAFVAIMTTHGAVALALSRLLVARLGAATRRVAENATLSAAGRIHAELLRRGRDGTIRPLPVFSELALAVQSTRETVSRTINALEKRGIVRRADDALVIVARHRLEELVY